MAKTVDYSNQTIINDYGKEVQILDLYEQKRRASYWNYICPYCGNKDVNDIYKIKKAKTCKHCRAEYLSKVSKTGNGRDSKIYLDRKKEKFYELYDDSLIELLDDYTTPDTKIKYRCKKCNSEFLKLPRDILKIKCCPNCNKSNKNNTNNNIKRKTSYKNKKTTDIFKKEIYKLCGEEFEVLGEYINSQTKITIKHNVCNKTFDMKPSNFLSGQRCPHCRYNKIAEANRKTDAEFKQEVFNLVGNEYSIKSSYNGRHKKVLFHHNKCDSDFWMTPAIFINNGGRCTNKECLHNRMSLAMKDTPEEFKDKFDKRSRGEYTLLSEYKSSNEKILIKHNVCETDFWMTPNSFLHGQGCTNKECVKNRIREKRALTKDDFIKRLYSYNDSLILLSDYVDITTKVTMKCKKCGYIWDVTPSNLLYSKTSCPKCKISHGEKVISNYLDNNNISYECQKKYESLLGVNNGALSYDFYLPERKLLIEFQGKQHYEPINAFGGQEYFEIQQEHDRRKRQYAKDNKIELLEIPYWDLNDIEEILSRELSLTA